MNQRLLAFGKDALRRHGWTALFAAVTLVVLRAESAEFALDSFKERIVSAPTVSGIDIAARNMLFTTSVPLFMAAFVATLLALSFVRRFTTAAMFELLEPLSIAGSCLWLAHAYSIDTQTTIELIISVELAVLAIGVLDARVFRRGEHPQAAAYVASLGLVAAGVIIVIADFYPPVIPPDVPWTSWHAGAWMIGGHLLARVVTWRRDPERRKAALVRLMPATVVCAWLPLVPLLRDELYLTLNNHGVFGVSPKEVEFAAFAVIGAWLLVSIVRNARAQSPPNLELRVLRASFPIFAFALTALSRYWPKIPLPTDLFEPANSGLFVQQLFEFGRVPFLETFNAHGLSDSFWSFVYRFLQGPGDEVANFYEFLNPTIGSVLVYWLLRRATGNGYLALFATLFATFRIVVFPSYCELAIASVLVLDRLIVRPTFWRWLGFGFYCVGVFLWRLDMGAANVVACGAVLVALRIGWRDFRPRPLHVGGAGALCAVVCGAAFFGLAAIRGVDGPHILHAVKHLGSSAQAFGRTMLANEYDASVLWHLAVFPMCVLALAVYAFFAPRVRAKFDAADSFRALFVLFGAAYYFANFQRGLVRHTWLEPGNVYVLSFGFAVLCLTSYLIADLSPRVNALYFLGIASVLAGSFGLEGPLPKSAHKFSNTWQTAITRRTQSWHVDYARTVIDRSPTSPDREANHYAAMRKFVADNLTPQQTFLDLTSSPVLNMILHRKSPHFVNHLYVIYDEWLQKSELMEFKRNDIPFVLAWMNGDLAARDGDVAQHRNFGDGVSNSLRQWLFHEWLHRGYEPWCAVQRWIVWRRKDWLAPTPPSSTEVRHLARAQCKADERRVTLHGETADAPIAKLDRDRIAFVRIDGRAQQRGTIVMRLVLTDDAGTRSELERSLVVEPGDATRYWTLPCDVAGRTLQSLELDATQNADFELREVALDDSVAANYATIVELSKPTQTPTLGQTAWLWANRDDRNALALPVLRELWPTSGPPQFEEISVALDKREFPRFVRGIDTKRPCFVLDAAEQAHAPVVGSRVRFAHSGERVVKRVDFPRIYVSGEPLDPERDGAPNDVKLITNQPSTLRARNSPRFYFPPLEDSTQPCYVHLRMTRLTPEARESAIVWGAGDASLGRVNFTVRGEGPQDYLVRISSQATWARARCNWIQVPTPNGAMEVVSARILWGD